MSRADVEGRIAALREHFSQRIPKHVLFRLAALLDVADIRWWASEIRDESDDRVSGRLVILTERSIVVADLTSSSMTRFDAVVTAIVDSTPLTDLLGVAAVGTDEQWGYPAIQPKTIELRFAHRDPVRLPLDNGQPDPIIEFIRKFV